MTLDQMAGCQLLCFDSFSVHGTCSNHYCTIFSSITIMLVKYRSGANAIDNTAVVFPPIKLIQTQQTPVVVILYSDNSSSGLSACDRNVQLLGNLSIVTHIKI